MNTGNMKNNTTHHHQLPNGDSRITRRLYAIISHRFVSRIKSHARDGLPRSLHILAISVIFIVISHGHHTLSYSHYPPGMNIRQRHVQFNIYEYRRFFNIGIGFITLTPRRPFSRQRPEGHIRHAF
jgi:hypothetical protein